MKAVLSSLETMNEQTEALQHSCNILGDQVEEELEKAKQVQICHLMFFVFNQGDVEKENVTRRKGM